MHNLNGSDCGSKDDDDDEKSIVVTKAVGSAVEEWFALNPCYCGVDPRGCLLCCAPSSWSDGVTWAFALFPPGWRSGLSCNGGKSKIRQRLALLTRRRLRPLKWRWYRLDAFQLFWLVAKLFCPLSDGDSDVNDLSAFSCACWRAAQPSTTLRGVYACASCLCWSPAADSRVSVCWLQLLFIVFAIGPGLFHTTHFPFADATQRSINEGEEHQNSRNRLPCTCREPASVSFIFSPSSFCLSSLLFDTWSPTLSSTS